MELLLGCGSSRVKKLASPDRPDWSGLVTLDFADTHKPDVVHDIAVLPLPFPDDTFDEIHAYEVLGVEFGSPLPVVTRAFRERAKKIHPDIRQGDRSSEPELRRIIEAYQFLKTDYFGSPASDSSQRPF